MLSEIAIVSIITLSVATQTCCTNWTRVLLALLPRMSSAELATSALQLTWSGSVTLDFASPAQVTGNVNLVSLLLWSIHNAGDLVACASITSEGKASSWNWTWSMWAAEARAWRGEELDESVSRTEVDFKRVH